MRCFPGSGEMHPKDSGLQVGALLKDFFVLRSGTLRFFEPFEAFEVGSFCSP